MESEDRPAAGNLAANCCMSRLEARLCLEGAMEARMPRSIIKKPSLAGLPLDLYALHQSILRFGGYRKVEMDNSWEQVGATMGLTMSEIGSARNSLREQSLRRLAWMEDEAPGTRVQSLQSSARRLLLPLPNEHSLGLPAADAVLPPALLGGGLEDIPPWLRPHGPNPFAVWPANGAVPEAAVAAAAARRAAFYASGGVAAAEGPEASALPGAGLGEGDAVMAGEEPYSFSSSSAANAIGQPAAALLANGSSSGGAFASGSGDAAAASSSVVGLGEKRPRNNDDVALGMDGAAASGGGASATTPLRSPTVADSAGAAFPLASAAASFQPGGLLPRPAVLGSPPAAAAAAAAAASSFAESSATKKTRLSDGTAARAAAAASAPISGAPLSILSDPDVLRHDAEMPAFKVRLARIHAEHALDAGQLYKIHDSRAQLAGAIAAHMPPHDLTDDEEAAFPAYCRSASNGTFYTEANRKDVFRYTSGLYVLPSGAAADAGQPVYHFPFAQPTIDEESTTTLTTIVKQLISTMPGKRQSLFVSPCYAIHVPSYLRAVANGWPGNVQPTEIKRLKSAEPLAARLLEGGLEQDPWIGSCVSRPQFYLDVRNHILLKWIQSQNPGHPRNDPWRYAARLGATAETATMHTDPGGSASSSPYILRKFSHLPIPFTMGAFGPLVPCAPTAPSWAPGASARYHGPAARALLPQSYVHPAPLTLAEVLVTIPVRLHELTAAVFDYLEARGKINIGAVALPLFSSPSVPAPPQPPLPTRQALATTFAHTPRALTRLSGPRHIINIVAGGCAASSPPRTPLPPASRKRILVVGAGISGLATARQLLAFGHDVILVEARGRPGGRISTNREECGMAVDEGAMISTGDEPNPFALIARQLGLRKHVISNTTNPLLLPRKYSARVAEMAAARTSRAGALWEWRARVAARAAAASAAAAQATLSSAVQAANAAAAAATAPKRQGSTGGAAALLLTSGPAPLFPSAPGGAPGGAGPSGGTGPTAPEALIASAARLASSVLAPASGPSGYAPEGREAFGGFRIPAELSHLSSETWKHAVRAATTHSTLMHDHLEFLRRLMRVLTGVAQAQVHDPFVEGVRDQGAAGGGEGCMDVEAAGGSCPPGGDAPAPSSSSSSSAAATAPSGGAPMDEDPSPGSPHPAPLRRYSPSYGILRQARPIPPKTAAALEAVRAELEATQAWLLRPLSEHTIDLLQSLMETRFGERAQPLGTKGLSRKAAERLTASTQAIVSAMSRAASEAATALMSGAVDIPPKAAEKYILAGVARAAAAVAAPVASVGDTALSEPGLLADGSGSSSSSSGGGAPPAPTSALERGGEAAAAAAAVPATAAAAAAVSAPVSSPAAAAAAAAPPGGRSTRSAAPIIATATSSSTSSAAAGVEGAPEASARAGVASASAASPPSLSSVSTGAPVSSPSVALATPGGPGTAGDVAAGPPAPQLQLLPTRDRPLSEQSVPCNESTAPYVLPVPGILDADAEAYYNDLLTESGALRRHARPPRDIAGQLFPVLRGAELVRLWTSGAGGGDPMGGDPTKGQDIAAVCRVVPKPLLTPPGWVVAGNEIVRSVTLAPEEAAAAGRAAAAFSAAAAAAASGGRRASAPLKSEWVSACSSPGGWIEPRAVLFTSGAEGSVIAAAGALRGWDRVYPRARLERFLGDPRRVDDEVDEIYERAPLMGEYRMQGARGLGQAPPEPQGQQGQQLPAPQRAQGPASRGGRGGKGKPVGGGGTTRGGPGAGAKALPTPLSTPVPPSPSAAASAAAAAAAAPAAEGAAPTEGSEEDASSSLFSSPPPSSTPLAPSSSSSSAAATPPIFGAPRTLTLGYRSTWDVPLGLAIEYLATLRDAMDVEASRSLGDWLRAEGGGAEGQGAPVPEGSGEPVLPPSSSPPAGSGGGLLTPEDLADGAATVPWITGADADTDGLLAASQGTALQSYRGAVERLGAGGLGLGGAAPPPSPDSPNGPSTGPLLTYARLRRALLRWHVANLEYGCARSVYGVSLQAWDQDDAHNFHDRGRHTFNKDGYDTFVRGLLGSLPVAYNTEVTAIKWTHEGGNATEKRAATAALSSPSSPASSSSSSAAAAPPPKVRVSLRPTGPAYEGGALSAATEVEVDAVVVTVPIAVLQSGRPGFDPPLPEWKRNAIQGIGAGLLNKVVLRFPKAFWRDNPAPAPAAQTPNGVAKAGGGPQQSAAAPLSQSSAKPGGPGVRGRQPAPFILKTASTATAVAGGAVGAGASAPTGSSPTVPVTKPFPRQPHYRQRLQQQKQAQALAQKTTATAGTTAAGAVGPLMIPMMTSSSYAAAGMPSPVAMATLAAAAAAAPPAAALASPSPHLLLAGGGGVTTGAVGTSSIVSGGSWNATIPAAAAAPMTGVPQLMAAAAPMTGVPQLMAAGAPAAPLVPAPHPLVPSPTSQALPSGSSTAPAHPAVSSGSPVAVGQLEGLGGLGPLSEDPGDSLLPPGAHSLPPGAHSLLSSFGWGASGAVLTESPAPPVDWEAGKAGPVPGRGVTRLPDRPDRPRPLYTASELEAHLQSLQHAAPSPQNRSPLYRVPSSTVPVYPIPPGTKPVGWQQQQQLMQQQQRQLQQHLQQQQQQRQLQQQQRQVQMPQQPRSHKAKGTGGSGAVKPGAGAVAPASKGAAGASSSSSSSASSALVKTTPANAAAAMAAAAAVTRRSDAEVLAALGLSQRPARHGAPLGQAGHTRVVSFAPCIALLLSRFHLQPGPLTEAQLLVAVTLAVADLVPGAPWSAGTKEEAPNPVTGVAGTPARAPPAGAPPPSALRALGAAGDACGALEARVVAATDVFRALRAVLEAGGDVGAAAALLVRWYGGAAPLTSAPLLLEGAPPPGPEFESLRASLEYAAEVFPTPLVAPSPHYSHATLQAAAEAAATDLAATCAALRAPGAAGPQPLTAAARAGLAGMGTLGAGVSAGTAVFSPLSGALGAAATFAATSATPVVPGVTGGTGGLGSLGSLSVPRTQGARPGVTTSSTSNSSLAVNHKPKPATSPFPSISVRVPPAPAPSSAAAPARYAPPPTHGITLEDDSFGRVVVEDGPGGPDAPRGTARRGEAYMFWCMDRPSAGAGIQMGPQPGGAAAAAAGAGAGAGGAQPHDLTLAEAAAAAGAAAADDGVPVLIVMMAGEAAEWVEASTDLEVLNTVMQALYSMFPKASVPRPTAGFVTRWKGDPLAGMSYSYLPPGSHGAFYDLVAAPVDGQIFFAGEATNRHHPTTAAGAYDSGVREAVRIGGAAGRSRDWDVANILQARQNRLSAAFGNRSAPAAVLRGSAAAPGGSGGPGSAKRA